jgi:hypothetical protein
VNRIRLEEVLQKNVTSTSNRDEKRTLNGGDLKLLTAWAPWVHVCQDIRVTFALLGPCISKARVCGPRLPVQRLLDDNT